MKKVLLFLAITVSTMLSTVWAYDFSAVSSSGHTLYYEIISGTTNVGVVRPGEGNTYNNYVSGNVVIPATVSYNGTTYNVTRLKSIVGADGYDYGSFDGCTGLTSVNIPNSVTTIGEYAFYNCSGLTSITIPNSVTSIGSSAFRDCSSLTTLNFNAINCNDFTAQYESELPFYGCPISTITIGNSVQRIPTYFAYKKTSLTSITIPYSVTRIGGNAFYLVKNIIYSGRATGSPWGALNVNGYIDGDYIYSDNTKTTLTAYIGSSSNVIIPNSVTTIRRYAFAYCTGLTSVTIPNSVTSIGENAFRDCSGLTSVTIPNSVTYIENNAFCNCSGLTSVTIPNSVTYIENNAFYNCSGLTSVTIPNSVTYIENNAFYLVKNIIYSGRATGSPWGALNVNGYIDGDFVYSDSTKTILTAYIGTSSNVTIPNSVTSIGEYAFYNCSGLTSVTIPNSVTSIGEGAFYNCSGLTSVTIPNSVASIGEGAFYNCSGLTSVTIPNSVTTIGNLAFCNCSGLTSVTIPNSVTTIGNYAFSGCSGLTTLNFNAVNCSDFSSSSHPFSSCPISTITIGDSVQRIPAYFAYNNSSLTSLTIGNSVTSIGNSAFSGCSGLTTLNFNAVNCSDFSYSNHPFSDCPISTINIGNSVQRIPAYFAYNKSALTSITIPNSVTSIGNYAFTGCSGLTTLNFNAVNCSDFSSSNHPFSVCPISTINIGDSVQRIPAYFAYNNNSSLTSLTIGNSVTSIEDYAFYNCSGLTSVTIPNSVTSIGSSAFSECTGLTSVTIPDSVTSIGKSAFRGCSGLTSVSIPNSVTTIGNSAFSGCSSLTTLNFNAVNCSDFSSSYPPFDGCPTSTINIGDSVQRIPAYFAYNKSSLTSLTIPNSVTTIGNSAFYNCTGLTSVSIPNSVTSIGSSVFYNCSGLTSVSIPNSVTSIGSYTFYHCTGLTSVTIGNSVTTIGEYAFYNCSGLTSVTIPNSVTSIGNSAFRGCSSLTSVNIPNSVTTIGSFAFSGCSSLTSVTIGNSVTSIGSYAFRDCTGLTSVIIPNSVTTIGNYAFNNCTSLTTLNFNAINCSDFSSTSSYHPFYGCPISTINIGDSVQRIPGYFADDRTSLTSITIPNPVTSIGNYAFRNCTSLTTLNFNAVNCSDFSSSNYPFSDSPISTITIGNSVQRIPAYFVYNKTAISEIIIPNGVTSIGNSAFYGCSGLDTIIIPNGITTIEESTFENCNNLAYAVIGKNISSIGNKAFYGCNNLHNVKSLASFPPTLGSNIFSATAILKVPCGSAAYYSAPAAKWADYFISIEEVCDNITITVISANENMGTVSGSGEYLFGSEVTITATPKQGYRFVSWNDGNTENPRTIVVEAEATYIATFEEEIGIETASELDELRLYPNPTSGTITFNSTDISKVEVMDAMGRMVAVYNDSYIIDLSKLSKGYYTLRVTTDRGVAIRKVVRN